MNVTTNYRHKFIECLLDDRRCAMGMPDNRPRELTLTRKMREQIAHQIEQTDIFCFGDLPMEFLGWNDEVPPVPQFQIPKLSEDELGMWSEKLLPLPSPKCWFEFEVSLQAMKSIERRITGLLVMEAENKLKLGWQVMRLDYITHEDCVMLTGIGFFWPFEKEHEDVSQCFMNTALVEELYREGRHEFVAIEGACGKVAVYLTLMLNSMTTEKERAPAPTKLNHKRIAKGRLPIHSHTIVTIVPERFKRGTDKGGSHASPRLHWRRSHRRTLHSGKVIVIPRHLVGRADLGDVSHEYKVGS